MRESDRDHVGRNYNWEMVGSPLYSASFLGALGNSEGASWFGGIAWGVRQVRISARFVGAGALRAPAPHACIKSFGGFAFCGGGPARPRLGEKIFRFQAIIKTFFSILLFLSILVNFGSLFVLFLKCINIECNFILILSNLV